MKIFLAGVCRNEELVKKYRPKYMLESFYYIKEWQKDIDKYCDEFLLDSGAFTFMNGRNGDAEIDWMEYARKYADYIVENDVKLFFELDIDVITGYEYVKTLRRFLEETTGRKCIPVWHRSRGLDEWERLTREYDKVAIGGFAMKHITQKEYKFIPTLLRIAHENQCEVHGLGFTSMRYLSKVPFDSVDSTTWLGGSRFGEVYVFQNGRLKKQSAARLNMRIPKENVASADENNLREWVKFQHYADKFM